MAPERRRTHIDRRTGVFSLRQLYHLLTAGISPIAPFDPREGSYRRQVVPVAAADGRAAGVVRGGPPMHRIRSNRRPQTMGELRGGCRSGNRLRPAQFVRTWRRRCQSRGWGRLHPFVPTHTTASQPAVFAQATVASISASVALSRRDHACSNPYRAAREQTTLVRQVVGGQEEDRRFFARPCARAARNARPPVGVRVGWHRGDQSATEPRDASAGTR